ncbi:MAG: hypothetical protein ACOY58_04080 [Candidatus Micrarchaeota archaeon]
MERDYGQTITEDPRQTGPSCRLDRETFALLASRYKVGRYGEGLRVALGALAPMASHEMLKKTIIVVKQARRQAGIHLIQMYLNKMELQILDSLVEKSGLRASDVIAALAYLYFRLPVETSTNSNQSKNE